MTTSASSEPIYSTLANDPDLAELVELFVREMPGRIHSMQQAFQSEDIENLRRATHQLKGAAGSYGFPAITSAAADVEQSLITREPHDAIRGRLDQLLDVCQRVRAGKSC